MFSKKSNSFLKFFSFLMIMSAILVSVQVSAQQMPMQQQPPQSADYSDSELIVFINAAQKVMPLQQESQMKMIEEVEGQDLTVEEFNEILEAQSTGEQVTATEEDLTAFNNAIEGIEEIQMEYQEIISGAIEEEGISLQKYEQIMTSYQTDPDLQMRLNQLMEEQQED